MNWPKPDAKHLIVTAKQMECLEAEIFSNGLPVESLMEKVGLLSAKWLLDRPYLLRNGVIVVVGPGHNGADGLVVARELYLARINVSIWCPLPLKKQLTISHFSYANKIGIAQLNSQPSLDENKLWIDALFGIGQTKSLPKRVGEIFKIRQEKQPGRLISLDIPSGLCSDTGKSFSGGSATASITLTMGLFKQGLIQDDAIEHVGKLQRIDLGLPSLVLAQIPENQPLRISSSDIDNIRLPYHPSDSNKYQRGRSLIIAGSEKYPGAAHIALKGALSSGLGSIKAALPSALAENLWQVAPEVVLQAELPEDIKGGLSMGSFLESIDFSRFDSLLIGPGIGVGELWDDCAKELERFEGLIVFDADALNRISSSSLGWEWFRRRHGPTWITPHLEEFQRLFPDIDISSRLWATAEASRLSGTSVLLKGAHSIIAEPGGRIWQLGESSQFVARSGLGDLLAGFLAGLGAMEVAAGSVTNSSLLPAAALMHCEAGRQAKLGTTASSIGLSLERIVKKVQERNVFKKTFNRL